MLLNNTAYGDFLFGWYQHEQLLSRAVGRWHRFWESEIFLFGGICWELDFIVLPWDRVYADSLANNIWMGKRLVICPLVLNRIVFGKGNTILSYRAAIVHDDSAVNKCGFWVYILYLVVLNRYLWNDGHSFKSKPDSSQFSILFVLNLNSWHKITLFIFRKFAESMITAILN